MKKLLITAALAIAAAQLHGCVAVPAIALVNSIHKSGTANYEVSGSEKTFPGAFRSAVQKAGGMVMSAGAEYGQGVFTNEQVKVEYQKLEAGGFRLVTSSVNGVARTYDFGDAISVKAESVANSLIAAGYTIKSSNRQRGI